MATHFSVDVSMPSARLYSSQPSSDEILARFEAEQAENRPFTPVFAFSLAGFSIGIVLLSSLALRSGAASSTASLATGAGTQATATAITWNTSFESAQQQATAQGKPMMVEFYTDWCSVCKRMDEGTYRDPAVVAESQNVVPVKINAEGRTDLAQRYGINSYPTFVWMDSAGRERARISGGYNPAGFVSLMQHNR